MGKRTSTRHISQRSRTRHRKRDSYLSSVCEDGVPLCCGERCRSAKDGGDGDEGEGGVCSYVHESDLFRVATSMVCVVSSSPEEV